MSSGDVDTGDLGTSHTNQMLMLSVFRTSGGAATLTADAGVQINNLTIYIDRTSAPRIDECAAAIWTDVTGLAPAYTEAIDYPLSEVMPDPDQMPADNLQSILAHATVPPLCGVIHGGFVCKNRPSAPTDNSRLWIVSDQLTDGLQWQVEADTSASKDYICLSYQSLVNSSWRPAGSPVKAFYPSDPGTANAARVGFVDAGCGLSDGEAALAMQQAYADYHNFVQGQITIPYQVHNGNGQLCSIEHIECWDRIMNAGKVNAAEAGPFLISEVDIQGGIATVIIGSADGYAFDAPSLPVITPLTYHGSVTTRSMKKVPFATYWHWRYRNYAKKHPYERFKYPTMPKHHKKYGHVPSYTTSTTTQGYDT